MIPFSHRELKVMFFFLIFAHFFNVDINVCSFFAFNCMQGFLYIILSVISILTIILLRKKELIALL